MTQQTAPEQPSRVLDEKLRFWPRAKEAFERLYQLGCEPQILEFLCYWMMPLEPVTLPANESRPHPVVIHNRPLDSWDTAADGLNLEDLRKIAEESEQLWNKILRLRRTPLVRTLILMDELPRSSDDLLGGLPGCGDPFRGLKELPALAKKWFGPRQRPDFTRLLTALYEHIWERTRGWHDAEVAALLDALLPDPPKDLKQWRYDRDLSRPRSGPNDPHRI